MRIAIIDYNAGNVASVANALRRLGFEYVITRDPATILSADKVIFPGQGRAGSAMQNLREAGLAEVLPRVRKPFLGICLGMQLLYENSEEDETVGLGIIPGRVKKFVGEDIKVPQIGWNTASQVAHDPLFNDVPGTFYAYFVNSYYAERSTNDLAGAVYGDAPLSAVVRNRNFYGIQFHPEKSGSAGLQVLKNFCELDIEQPKKTLIIPAIDIVDGKCVRLTQGDYSKETVYGEPLAIARALTRDGARYLHVIDLDGARAGKPVNAEPIVNIAKETDLPIQVGGGIRTFEAAQAYFDAGIKRVIVSTAAVDDPKMIERIVAEYGPERIVVSVDIRNGFVATMGWQEITTVSLDELLRKLSELGVTTLIYTDIERDGTLQGPSLERIRDILSKPFKVIIAGGISTAGDIRAINDLGAYGVIVGKALYEKTVRLEELQDILAPEIVGLVRPQKTVTKRIIPCMDVAGGRVVKGTNFKNLRDSGDPVELAKRYSEEGADELVFLDITATIEGREALYELVRSIAKEVNIPFTVGGGVRTIRDVKKLLDAGADKVSIGSAAVTDPDLVRKAAREFGSQCIVISIDPRRSGASWEVYIKGGREATGVDAVTFAKDMAECGAGELLVNSLDRDGTREGYDIELIRSISDAVSIPVIASSGAGSREDFVRALVDGGADAALAASLFHEGTVAIGDLKNYLTEQGINIRV